MDGERLRAYWSQEVEEILTTYKEFETLLPNAKKRVEHLTPQKIDVLSSRYS